MASPQIPSNSTPSSGAIRDPGKACVLILGTGINGVAIARELLLNRVHVLLVDSADTCFGATAYSSRLIHGGLRYLEYGEFDLVRESIEERDRLLRLAPEFVRPLELFIPTSNLTGGILGSIGRFMGWKWWPGVKSGRRRGKWLVQMGLEMYDLYAGGALPRHKSMKVGAYNSPPVNPEIFSSVCRYFDAQVQYPERYVLAMLHDCRKIAAELSIQFEFIPYCQSRLVANSVELRPNAHSSPRSMQPAAIINATGAWVDHTLASLPLSSKRLIGGTRGTHLFIFHDRLKELLHGKGVYSEAEDGRPIFILPLGECVLVGTTDDPFETDPATAVSSESEIDYLLRALNSVFPQCGVTRSDVNFHGCGVRPLPYVDHTSTAAVTRRHSIHRHSEASLPFWSIIGGKLTTSRSLAEEVAETVLQTLELPLSGGSKERVLPGNDAKPSQLSMDWSHLARQHGLTHQSVNHVWSLVGTSTPEILAASSDDGNQLLPDVQMPAKFARWVIQNEWVTTLDDLVERRLMLLYHQRLTTASLTALAKMLADADKLSASEVSSTVQATTLRLATHFGKQVDSR